MFFLNYILYLNCSFPILFFLVFSWYVFKKLLEFNYTVNIQKLQTHQNCLFKDAN